MGETGLFRGVKTKQGEVPTRQVIQQVGGGEGQRGLGTGGIKSYLHGGCCFSIASKFCTGKRKEGAGVDLCGENELTA